MPRTHSEGRSGIFRLIRASRNEIRSQPTCLCQIVCLYAWRGALPPASARHGGGKTADAAAKEVVVSGYAEISCVTNAIKSAQKSSGPSATLSFLPGGPKTDLDRDGATLVDMLVDSERIAAIEPAGRSGMQRRSVWRQAAI